MQNRKRRPLLGGTSAIAAIRAGVLSESDTGTVARRRHIAKFFGDARYPTDARAQLRRGGMPDSRSEGSAPDPWVLDEAFRGGCGNRRPRDHAQQSARGCGGRLAGLV